MLLATALVASTSRRGRSRSCSPTRYSQSRRNRSYSRGRSRQDHSRSRSGHRSHWSRRSRRSPSPPSSPLKAPDPLVLNLTDCLENFHKISGHDLRECEAELKKLAYTPVNIRTLTVERLSQLIGCVEGLALTFQMFCTDWVAKKEREVRRRA